MEPMTVDVNALQNLPQDEQRAIDDLARAELRGCTIKCLFTCRVT
jgi:hypothetical protein